MTSLDPFLHGLKPADRICILHHPDPDGLCAAVIIAKALQRLGHTIALRLSQPPSDVVITGETLTRLERERITKLITCDLAIDQRPSTVVQAEGGRDILVFDHHRQSTNIRSPRTTVIHAQEFTERPENYPATKLAFDTFSQHCDISELDWIAAIGILSDRSYDAWKEFIDKSVVRHGVSLAALETLERVLSAAALASDPAVTADCFAVLSQSRGPLEALRMGLERHASAVQNAIDDAIVRFPEKAVFSEAAIYYELVGPFAIDSPVSSIIRDSHPGRTIIVVRKEGAYAHVNVRRSDSLVNLAALVRASLEGLPDAFGGGHTPAAGATIPLAHFDAFMQRFLALNAEQALRHG